MKGFSKFFVLVIVMILAVFAGANFILLHPYDKDKGRPYQVEIHRIARLIEEEGLSSVDLSAYDYVTKVEKYGQSEDFFQTGSDYSIRKIDDVYYRFDYTAGAMDGYGRIIFIVNGILAMMAALLIFVLLYIRQKIIIPFEKMTVVPYELSKGNLAVPIKESKSRFFGKFAWGMDLLRENMEQQKQQEYELRRNKKTLLLSASHDIKTPLLAIKLYAKALTRELYSDKEKQKSAAQNIYAKAGEIENYVRLMAGAFEEEIPGPGVMMGEFYLSEVMNKILHYYGEKLALIRTEFAIEDYADCLLKGDCGRSIEALENVMENAMKYGDGHYIRISFLEEENCRLISVSNSGCTLEKHELPHVFDSYWRGSNAKGKSGSGLGLFICRQLMYQMNGDIFAEISDGVMVVTLVFGKA